MLRGFVSIRRMKRDYLIESFFVVSLIIVDEESLIILVESLIIDVLSDTVVVDVVDSVFELEQAVAKAIIDRKKKADFAMSLVN
ncbi:hypothetical protein GCM10028818_39350 [Spirosoma horti]